MSDPQEREIISTWKSFLAKDLVEGDEAFQRFDKLVLKVLPVPVSEFR